MKVKKKFSNIMGVMLSLALLSSMIIVAIPVAASTQAWSTLTTPSATGLVLDTGNTFTGPFAQASNGDIYASSNVGGNGATLVKSIDGGRTWTAPAGFPTIGSVPGEITDIVTSSIDANTVYVTDGFDIWKTTDGGTTWVPLSNLFTGGAGADGVITSIDVGYLGTNPYIFAATSEFGISVVGNGGAYVAQEAVWGMPWTDLLIHTDRPVTWSTVNGTVDVLDIMVDPVNFATTQMIMALATNYNTGDFSLPDIGDATTILDASGGDSGVLTITSGTVALTVTGSGAFGTTPVVGPGTTTWSTPVGGDTIIITVTAGPVTGSWTRTSVPATATVTITTDVDSDATSTLGSAVITTKYGGAQWDATVNDVALPGVANALLNSGSLWLPSNFDSSLGSGNMQLFAAVDSGEVTKVGDVFLAVFGAPAGSPTAAFDLNLRGTNTATEITGLDGTGSIGTAQLLASGYDPTTVVTAVVPATYRSSNGGFTWLANTKGPTGGATPLSVPYPGVNPALSSVLVLSTTDALVATHGADAGVSITNDSGLTWNGISLLNTTTPFASIDDLELGSLFMTTNTNTAAGAVWRYDDTNWERVFSASLFANATTNFVVEASPAGDSIFIADIGGITIWRSTDDGQTWTAQTNFVPGAISGLVVIDANNQVVGGPADIVYTTATNGGFWFTRTATVGTIQSLVYDQGTGDLLVGGTTNIRRSTDGGVNWTAITTPLTATITATSLVFSGDYGNDSTIYVTGTDANANTGVWRYDFSATTPAWVQIDNRLGAPPTVTTTTTITTTFGADAFSLTEITGPVLGTSGGTSTSTWSTVQKASGDYSALLNFVDAHVYIDFTPSAVITGADFAAAAVTDYSFAYYFTKPTSGGGPQMELTFVNPADSSDYIDVTYMLQNDAVEDTWTTADLSATYGEIGTWTGTVYTSFPTTALVQSAIGTTNGTWVLTKVRIELYNDPAPARTAYIDNVEIATVTHNEVLYTTTITEGLGGVMVAVASGSPVITYVPGTNGVWTVIMLSNGDAVSVTAVAAATGNITATAAGNTLAVSDIVDENSNAIIPASPIAGGSVNIPFALPDIATTTTTTTTTTTVTPYNVNSGTGLVSAPDGALYATDSSIAGAGVSRSINPTDTAANVFFDQVPSGSTVTLAGLWRSDGSNVLWSIGDGNSVRTYTDTLVVAGTGVAVTAFTTNTASIAWNDLVNATGYLVVVNTTAQTNRGTAVNSSGVVVVVNNTANTAAVTGLVTNATYNVSVWAVTPVSSFQFNAASFTTLPGVPTIPLANLIPVNGAINIPISGPAFAWAAPSGGAISYDWQLSTNPQFLTLVDELSITVPYLVWDGPLEYETAYYWRVRSVTGAGPSTWITSVFTTVAEAPDLEVPPPPTPIITIVIPDFEIPEIVMPDIILPPIEFPDIILPDIIIPDIVIPDFEIAIPDIVLPPIQIPEIVIPDIVIPPLEQPNVIVNLPTPPAPITVIPVIEAPPTPAYVWAIVGIGAVLSIAVIILIVRTRRIV